MARRPLKHTGPSTGIVAFSASVMLPRKTRLVLLPMCFHTQMKGNSIVALRLYLLLRGLRLWLRLSEAQIAVSKKSKGGGAVGSAERCLGSDRGALQKQKAGAFMSARPCPYQTSTSTTTTLPTLRVRTTSSRHENTTKEVALRPQ